MTVQNFLLVLDKSVNVESKLGLRFVLGVIWPLYLDYIWISYVHFPLVFLKIYFSGKILPGVSIGVSQVIQKKKIIGLLQLPGRL